MTIKSALHTALLMFFVWVFSAPVLAAESASGPSKLLSACGRATVGTKAPWLSGWTLDEHVFNVDMPFKDKKVQRVALVFWASWCGPCRSGLQQLATAKDDLRNAGVSVVLINVGEKSAKVSNFFGNKRPSFQVVLDPYGNCRKTFLRRPDGHEGLPLTVILNRERIVTQIIGTEGTDYIKLLLERETSD